MRASQRPRSSAQCATLHSDPFSEQRHGCVLPDYGLFFNCPDSSEEGEYLLYDPEDQPWAMRDFTLFDPSGVLWRVAQNTPRKEGF